MGLLLFHAWLLNPQQKRPLEFPFMNRCTSHFCIQRVILLKPNYNLLNFWLIDNGARWYKILQKVSFQSQFYFSDAKLLKMSHFRFSILAFSTNFCPIKVDLSGNTVESGPKSKNGPIWPVLAHLKLAVKPDRSLLLGQKLVENAKIGKTKMRHFV